MNYLFSFQGETNDRERTAGAATPEHPCFAGEFNFASFNRFLMASS